MTWLQLPRLPEGNEANTHWDVRSDRRRGGILNVCYTVIRHSCCRITKGILFLRVPGLKKEKMCSKNAGSNAHTMKILWRYSWKPDEGKKNRDNNFDGTARGKFSHNTIVSSSCPWKRQIKPSIAEQSFPPQFPGRWLRIRLPSSNCQWRADEE